MAISTFVHDKTKGKAFPGYDVHGYHEVSYEGAVLSTGEVNGYDDSDFYAVVWDEASGSIKTHHLRDDPRLDLPERRDGGRHP